MDARLPRLETIRVRKAEAARLHFMMAYREFAAAHRRCDALRQRRAAASRLADEAASAELARLAGGAGADEVAAVHEGDRRRRAALAALDREIAGAEAERDRLRGLAVEAQRLYQLAKRTAEKLGLMVGKLRRDEISLQTRLVESRHDSALRDANTRRWKLQPTDT